VDQPHADHVLGIVRAWHRLAKDAEHRGAGEVKVVAEKARALAFIPSPPNLAALNIGEHLTRKGVFGRTRWQPGMCT
jgi:hypothetical protein